MLSDSIRDYLKTDPLITHALKKTGLSFDDLLKFRVIPPDSIGLDFPHSIFPGTWPVISSFGAFEALSPNSTSEERAAFFRAVRPAVLSIFVISMPPGILRTVLGDWLDNQGKTKLAKDGLAYEAARREGGKATGETRKNAKEERIAEVKSQWENLKENGVPEHERAGKIRILNEKSECLSTRTVRRYLFEAGLAQKK